jgi:hypothetical protein
VKQQGSGFRISRSVLELDSTYESRGLVFCRKPLRSWGDVSFIDGSLTSRSHKIKSSAFSLTHSHGCGC